MYYIPSLLEYTVGDFNKKTTLILSNNSRFLAITKQQNSIISLHLDFVLNNFAKQRNVKPSLKPDQVFKLLLQKFPDYSLQLSIHLMGDEADLVKCLEFFSNLNLPKQWESTVFVPHKYYDTWKTRLNHGVGIWYDLTEWQDVVFKPMVEYLLMTVEAGKSGQILDSTIKEKSLLVAKKNLKSVFYLDGGWGVDEASKLDNLRIISYTNFWKTFLNSK